jgi:excisionase family DNA binding protein
MLISIAACVRLGESPIMFMQQEVTGKSVLPILVSRKTAARLLSLSLRSVDEMLAVGTLPRRKVGRRVLIPSEALMRFAEVQA